MTYAYWKQWDSDDLNSLPGDFEEATIQKNEDSTEADEILKAEKYVKQDPKEGNEMYDYGFSFKDFL